MYCFKLCIHHYMSHWGQKNGKPWLDSLCPVLTDEHVGDPSTWLWAIEQRFPWGKPKSSYQEKNDMSPKQNKQCAPTTKSTQQILVNWYTCIDEEAWDKWDEDDKYNVHFLISSTFLPISLTPSHQVTMKTFSVSVNLFLFGLLIYFIF